MSLYKIKHIPTGLYYQPHKHRGNNLSQKGKVYQSATHGLSSAFRDKHKQPIFTVQCEKDSVVYNKTAAILNWKPCSWAYNQVVADTLVDDWQIEHL